MNPVLEQIFLKREFISKNGGLVKIHSETSRSQCEFLQKIIADNQFRLSIEIGLAFGISAIAITDAVTKNGGKHFVVDKFQLEAWNGYGLELLQLAGLIENVEFFEAYCYQVLPKLLEEGHRFDFAYIDSTKQFDWNMVDFFFLDKLLNNGGIIVFDDTDFPGIRKLLRYVIQFPSYRLYATHPSNSKSRIDKVSALVKLIPGSKKLFKENVLRTDSSLGINSHCVAIQKIAEDTRNWDWHVNF